MKKLIKLIIYALGIVSLALGIVLNGKTGLGVSPISSIPFAISEIYKLNYGNITFFVYLVYIAIQIILFRSDKKQILMILLQLPFSLFFSRFLNLFINVCPDMSNSSMLIRVVIVLLGIVFTGVGAGTIISLKLVPNPADGVVQSIALKTNKSAGTIKNIFDFTCLCVTLLICLITRAGLVGVGFGTILAMLLVGRVIAIYQKLMNPKYETMFK